MFLVERRISLFWIVHGQRRMSMSLQSLPGLGLGSRRWSTIGSGGWQLKTIVLQNWFLVGLSTDRAPLGTRRPPMNFSMPVSVGLETRIHGLDQPGKRGKDWRSS